MQTRDIVYQRQPQPGAGYRARVIEAAKRHQRLVYLLVVNSRAAVFHAEQHGVAVAMQAKRDRTIFRGIANGIVEQVSAQFPQQNAIACHLYRRLLALIAKIDMFAPRLRNTRKAAVAHNFRQVNHRKRLLPLFYRRQLQQPLR